MAGREQRTLGMGILGWLLLPAMVLAEPAPVEVDRVSFRTVAEDWWQATVRLHTQGDLSPDARDPDFTSDVGLILSVAFPEEGGAEGTAPRYTFYQSAVRLPVLERGGRRLVPFYLPGGVVRRDRLPERPLAWVVQLSVEGEPLPVRRGQFGGALPTRESYDHFLRRARAEAVSRDGWLRPVYRTPARIVASGGIDPRELPAFARPGPPP